MNISLYGGCGETYRRMCGQDAYDRVVRNIGRLRQAGIDVRLNVSLTPYNYQDLELICQKAQELGVHMKATGYMYPSIRVNGGQYGCGDRLCAEDAARVNVKWDQLRYDAELFEKRAQAMRELTLVEDSECGLDLDEGVRCRAGSSAFWMTWDGRMLPCGMMPYPTVYPLETGFSAAWEELRRLTRQIRTTPECAACPKRGCCPTCAAVSITETGSFDGKPEYVCRMTDETIRLTWEAYQERKKHED